MWTADEMAAGIEAARAHLATPFHEPERATVLDFAVDGARDFGPERASGANIYESVVKHLGNLRKNGQKVVLASYSIGARERLSGLLADHGLRNVRQADPWQEALGKAEKHVALNVLPLDHGFPSPPVHFVTDQALPGHR